MRDLAAGRLIDEMPCNLKNCEVSPSHAHILDYAQSILEGSQIVVHLRYVFGKKEMYFFLMDRASCLKGQQPIYSEILRLL